MDQALDIRQQKSTAPQRTQERAPAHSINAPPGSALTPVLEAIRAGLPARALPPATLAQLAEYLGNSAMEALLELESPGPTLAPPSLGPPMDGPARVFTPEGPELTGPPSFPALPPLPGPGGDPAALRAYGAGAAWCVWEGGDLL